MAKKSEVFTEDTLVTPGGSYVRYLTLAAADDKNMVCMLRDGGPNGPARWPGKVQAGTTQHFVFPDPMHFAAGIYVEVDDWGSDGKIGIGYA